RWRIPSTHSGLQRSVGSWPTAVYSVVRPSLAQAIRVCQRRCRGAGEATPAVAKQAGRRRSLVIGGSPIGTLRHGMREARTAWLNGTVGDPGGHTGDLVDSKDR